MRHLLVAALASMLALPVVAQDFRLEYGSVAGLDDAEAAKWYRKAAEQGHALAQYTLGVMYQYGRVVPQDYAEATKWYRKAAEQGHAVAQYKLGLMYHYGYMPKDLAEAVKWYRKAAVQGHPSAQNALGLMYRNGTGVARDFDEMDKWFSKVADVLAQYKRSGVYVGDYPPLRWNAVEVAKWHQKSAEQGDATAQYKLGIRKGYHADEAAKWYRKAAQQGHAPAQYELGLAYFVGAGVSGGAKIHH